MGAGQQLSPGVLKGIAEERRTLRVTLTKAGPTDIAVSFPARNDIPNLGGRDGVSFLGALSAISSSFRGLVIR